MAKTGVTVTATWTTASSPVTKSRGTTSRRTTDVADWQRFVADDEDTWPPPATYVLRTDAFDRMVIAMWGFGRGHQGRWIINHKVDKGFDPELSQVAWQPLP